MNRMRSGLAVARRGLTRWTALSTVLKRSLHVRPSLVEPKAAIVGSTEESLEEDFIAALDSLPDDVLGLIIVVCGNRVLSDTDCWSLRSDHT